jgi:hypothetical protein
MNSGMVSSLVITNAPCGFEIKGKDGKIHRMDYPLYWSDNGRAKIYSSYSVVDLLGPTLLVSFSQSWKIIYPPWLWKVLERMAQQ